MATGTTGQLGLALPVQGELSGTWGDTVNNGITQYTNLAIAATLTLTGDGAVTLANTTGDATASNITSTLAGAGTVTAQFAIVRISGTLTTTKVVTAPSYSKTYVVVNAATGGAVTFKASGQTGISVAVGESAYVYYNGTDYIKISSTATTSSQWTTSGSDIYYNTGNVLVGATASNGYKFEATATTDVAQFIATDAGASGAQIQLFHDSASPAVDDVTSLINFAGRDSAAQATIYSRISGISTNVTNSSESGAIAFSTRNTGTFAERMRLDSVGNLLVGSTVKQVGSVPSIWANSATAANGGIGFVPDYEGAGEHSVVSYSASSSTFKGLNFDGTTIKFWTGPSGVTSERFRVGSAGQLGIGGANYGTAGQVLTSQGSGAAPTWAAGGGGGGSSTGANLYLAVNFGGF